MISDFRVRHIQEYLLSWFSENKRIYPWRLSNNPYNILIAEILLQQTHVSDNVLNAYNKLIFLYPNIFDLSKANIEDIEKIIKPLGLIYKSKVLIKLSCEIVEQHDGKIPNELNDLMSIFGIGDYIARAVLSFAFDKDIAIVDTNVARFIHRFFGLSKKMSANPARDENLREYAQLLISPGNSKEFNYAILDLCALICKHRLPVCSSCPLPNYCEFNLNPKLYKQ